ncbi:hypothetical protein DAPPUDRAFT_101618 [Daphnia pulex]|uniref:C1q domain-containing protein n=1 Tax=Daphnia pulex TaxID=6669 RepID=E9GDZ2_DAPPU|nr:hypothetical protein DAPPUDRAFT_101618 [Daphnia pulex]|eukprot:EFX82174.1 hypothetical protein DAPPUDRAFT_101618 [Daphnia pulex]
MQFIVMLILGIFFPAFAWIGFKLADFFERKTKWGPVANQPDVHHLMATVPEGKVDQLEKDDRFNKREIDRYEEQFQNLCAVTTNEKNQRTAEAHHQTFPPSVPIANNSAADECVTENQLSTLQFRIEKSKKEKVLHSETALKWEDTESQLRKEIADLENVVRNHKKALSIKVFEVDSLVQENELLTQNLDSVTTNLEIQLNKLSHLDPELSDEQFATSFPLETQNEEAKQEAIMWRTRFEALQSENRKMWEIREDTLRSGQKAKRLADEQLAALAEALTALQQAIPDAKKRSCGSGGKRGRDVGQIQTKPKLRTRLLTWIGYADIKTSPDSFHAQRVGLYDAVNTVVPYNLIRLNIGNALNPLTGVFVAPKAGRYYFAFTGLGWATYVKVQLQMKVGSADWIKIGEAHGAAWNTMTL